MWSEELCFGIGTGLGIWYLALPGLSPSRLIHVRSKDLEEQFFKRIGCFFAWEQYADPADSEASLIDKLDRGLPVMLQTDIYHLPYYGSKTHFPGHVITIWGYDWPKKLFWVSDTERVQFLAVPFAALRKARYSENSFFQSRGNLFAPVKIERPENLPAIINQAISDNSRHLLQGDNDYSGIKALEKWQLELPEWGSLTDWKWTARFTYQVIEKRGTGGGGFRLLYSRFLEEAAVFLPQVAALQLPALMRDSAAAWRELADVLKQASEETVLRFEPVRKKLARLIELETVYHEEALKLG